MAKISNKSNSGTDFADKTFKSAISKLTQTFGEPQYNTNSNFAWDMFFCWTCETEAGDIFTIYDWKEENKPEKFDVISFRIGAKNKRIGKIAIYELKKLGVVIK